jgi:TonB family protein
MNSWQYLLLVNVYLVLFYGFYALLLRKETFFQLNRVYLVCASSLSFIIPLIQAGWVQNLFITQQVHYAVYGSPITITQLKPVAAMPVTIGGILACLYLIGVLFLIGRLIWQLVVLNKIIKTDQQGVAYSFFKTIKVDAQANNAIINAHEQIHAEQWHSADVFIIEAVMIINWFNPVVYFYRRTIKHIHEFIADDHALKVAANKADYAMLLLTQTFNSPSHNLVNTFFNHSLLKRRIIMLQKDKSQRIKLLKYGLSAPLFILMLILSSATVNNSKAIKIINLKAEQVVLMPINGKTISDPADLPNSHHPYATTITVDAKNVKLINPKKQITLQLDTTPKNTSPIFVAVEKEPNFPGGQQKFMQFIAENIKFPQDMTVNNTSGRVIATFIVEADGSLSNIKILRSPSLSAADEAIRVLLLSPKWNPGYQNGQPVRVQFTVPISFLAPNNVIGETVVKPDTTQKAITIGLTSTPAPLYIVDGKEMKAYDFRSVQRNDINSIYVLKDKDAVTKYGSKGTYGVILVFTKTYTGPMPATQPTVPVKVLLK